MSYTIKDSGERREFESGAVRDIKKGVGRCDLLPLGVLDYYFSDTVFEKIDQYIKYGETSSLKECLIAYNMRRSEDEYTMFLEVSKHYEEGCIKYGENNWQKGIPLHCFIDSAVRHYLKLLRGDTDENHSNAFVWNILGAMWTHNNKPELRDLPFAEVQND